MNFHPQESQSLGADTVLLLTVTIDPGATPMVARNDPAVRLADYEASLHAWLSSGSCRRIVMYENSGSDLSTLRTIAAAFPSADVEFHSFLGNSQAQSKGKGYSELLGISRVLSESRLLKDCRYVAKCTGRFTVTNARKLFLSINAEQFDIMCSLRSNLTYADSRLFVSTPSFLANYLLPRAAMVNDSQGVFFEHALSSATFHALADRRRWLPFPRSPVICGISGTFNTSLTDPLHKRLLRPLLDRLDRFAYGRG